MKNLLIKQLKPSQISSVHSVINLNFQESLLVNLPETRH